MLTRRGFLQTLGAALAGAAAFDPKSLLWVPAPKPVEIVDLAGTTAQAVIDEQLELNDLARRIAVEMTSRLERHKSVALREVMFRHNGTVHLPAGLLDIEEHGIGQFEPARSRKMVTVEDRLPKVDQMAWLLASEVQRDREIDMFAPVGVELRPGEPFTKDTLIGVGSDPESGLSVRVLRFEQEERRGSKRLLGVEIAGGKWHGRSHAKRLIL